MVWEELTKKMYSVSFDWKGQKAEGAGLEQQLDPTNVAPIQIHSMTPQLGLLLVLTLVGSGSGGEGGDCTQ